MVFRSKKKGKKGKDAEIKFGYIASKAYSFEKREIKSWKARELAEWFCAVGFGDVQKKFSNFLESGEELLQMDLSMDIGEELGNISAERKKQFFVYYHHLKECAYNLSKKNTGKQLFTQRFHTVLQKFIKANRSSFMKLDNKEIEEHCSILSDPSKIDQYLLNYSPKDEKLDIKLVINEIHIRYKVQEKLYKKQVYGPRETQPVFTKGFGNFHISVFVGPFYLQWTPSEIVEPIFGYGPELDILRDTDPIVIELGTKKKDIKTVRGLVAKLVAETNGKYIYRNSPMNRIEANCQTFLRDVLATFNTGLDSSPFCLKIPGALKRVLEVLPIRRAEAEGKKKKKDIDLYNKVEFKPCEDFVKLFKLEKFKNYSKWERIKQTGELQVVFETHSELDDFLYHCNQVTEAYFSTEHKFLQAIDRAFWIRHLNDKSKKNSKYKPSPIRHNQNKRGTGFGFEKSKICGCPMMHPQDNKQIAPNSTVFRKLNPFEMLVYDDIKNPKVKTPPPKVQRKGRGGKKK